MFNCSQFNPKNRKNVKLTRRFLLYIVHVLTPPKLSISLVGVPEKGLWTTSRNNNLAILIWC